MHLRLNCDLFLYTKKNIDDMVLGKQIIIENNCFFPIFVKKDNYKDKLLKNLESYMDKLQNNNIILDYDMCGLNCNDFKRATYFIHHDLEEGILLQKKIYKYIYNNG